MNFEDYLPYAIGASGALGVVLLVLGIKKCCSSHSGSSDTAGVADRLLQNPPQDYDVESQVDCPEADTPPPVAESVKKLNISVYAESVMTSVSSRFFEGDDIIDEISLPLEEYWSPARIVMIIALTGLFRSFFDYGQENTAVVSRLQGFSNFLNVVKNSLVDLMLENGTLLQIKNNIEHSFQAIQEERGFSQMFAEKFTNKVSAISAYLDATDPLPWIKDSRLNELNIPEMRNLALINKYRSKASLIEQGMRQKIFISLIREIYYPFIKPLTEGRVRSYTEPYIKSSLSRPT